MGTLWTSLICSITERSDALLSYSHSLLTRAQHGRALVKAQSHLKRLMIDTHQDLSLPKSALGINYLAADGSPELRLAGSGTFASVFLTAVQPPPVHRRPGFLTERRLYAYKVRQ